MDQAVRSRRTLGLEGELRDSPQLRVAMVGCGSHTYRNVLPVLRFVPELDLDVCCDLNLEKAEQYARSFGARRAVQDHRELLTGGEIDAVLLVLGFDEHDGRPLHAEVAEEFLAAGISVWMEKPPAGSRARLAQLRDRCAPGGPTLQVGFKKMFSPAVKRASELLAGLGPVDSYTYRYSVDLPEDPTDLMSAASRRFLDDFVHVASVIVKLVGLPEEVTSYRTPTGDGFLVMQHPTGTIGTVHLSKNASGLDAVEDAVLVSRGCTLRIVNGVFVEFHPRGWRGPYGRSTDYLPAGPDGGPADVHYGSLQWGPEFSLGTLGSGRHFVQGYYEQLRSFAHDVLARRQPATAGIRDALDVMAIADAVRPPFGQPVRTVSGTDVVSTRVRIEPEPETAPRCPRSGRALVLKDGWNYACLTCGATSTTMEGDVRACPEAELSSHHGRDDLS